MFTKGQSGNPKGRKKGVPNRRTELLNAIKYVQRTKDPETGKQRGSLLVHSIKQAYKDNTVLVAILKKLIPDLKATEITGPEGSELRTAVRIHLVPSNQGVIEAELPKQVTLVDDD